MTDSEKAAALWATFNDSERHGVRFGLFPAAKMPGDTPHAVTVALMAMAGSTKETKTLKAAVQAGRVHIVHVK